jgi:hypothetical protein
MSSVNRRFNKAASGKEREPDSGKAGAKAGEVRSTLVGG